MCVKLAKNVSKPTTNKGVVMYYRRIEIDAKAKAQHDHGLREDARNRLNAIAAKMKAAKKENKQAE
jgi:hypothetical protein